MIENHCQIFEWFYFIFWSVKSNGYEGETKKHINVDRCAFWQILLFCWHLLVKTLLVAFLFFYSAASTITNIQTRTTAHIHDRSLCGSCTFFYVNKKIFSLSLSLALLSVRTCALTHSQYICVEKSRRKKNRKTTTWGQRLVRTTLLASLERTRECSRDDVNIASSFILLMLLFLLIQDITLLLYSHIFSFCVIHSS